MPDTALPRIHGIRGATTVERNDAAEILGATDELLRAIIETNELRPDDIVSAFFTVTRDIDAAFPARAAEDFGWNIVALLHATTFAMPILRGRICEEPALREPSWVMNNGRPPRRQALTSPMAPARER
jgi:monofunctional chorismate mutase